MITFAIFYLIPRLAGATPESLAARYVGRSADPEHLQGGGRGAGLLRPRSTCSTGTGSRASSSARTSNIGAGDRALPRALPGLLLPQQPARCCPRSCSGFPVTLSLAVGAAIIWLIFGIAIGVLSALRRGSFFDRAAMTAGPGRRLAADLLDRPDLAGLLQLQARLDATGGVVHPADREPAGVGARPAAAVDHAGAAVLRAVRPAHPRRHARDHGRGLHPHGPGQGPARAHRGRQARPALGADPDRDHLRPRLRAAHRRRRPHRDRLRPARARPAGHRRRSTDQRPAAGARRWCWSRPSSWPCAT